MADEDSETENSSSSRAHRCLRVERRRRAASTRSPSRPISPQIGAVVSGIDLRCPLEVEPLRELRSALLRHQVLFVRDQDLDDEQHVAAAAQFGQPNIYPATRARGLDQPLEFIEDSEESPPKTDLWHTDVAYLERPPDIAMLNMRVAPPSGGDTLWCNLHAAYDKLSPTLQAFASSIS